MDSSLLDPVAERLSARAGSVKAPGQGANAARAEAEPLALSSATRWFMWILDEIDYGVMLVAERAKLLYANKVALRECSAHGFQIGGGFVRAGSERDHTSLLRALQLARTGRRSLLCFENRGSQLTLAAVPLNGTAEAANEAATLLVFGKRALCEPLSVEFFAQAHLLTTAEGAVLRGLCGGSRPVEIAERAGIAMSTVRTHIGNIRAKTGARSVRDLISKMTVLPPIVSAFHRIN